MLVNLWNNVNIYNIELEHKIANIYDLRLPLKNDLAQDTILYKNLIEKMAMI